jgi:hypothetical protein
MTAKLILEFVTILVALRGGGSVYESRRRQRLDDEGKLHELLKPENMTHPGLSS